MSIIDLYRLADAAVAGERMPMMLFPIGEWKSAKYPKLPLSKDLAEDLIANFEAGVLGTEPVVDSSGRHDTSSEAAGWMKRLYVAPMKGGGEALFADWEPTDLGADLLNERRYQYNSVEIGEVTDNATGRKTKNVLRSATLTNTPVLRMLPPVLEAGEAIASDPVELSLSEIDADDDPVAAIMADMESLASKLDAALKGKKGMPSVRTFMREIRSKVGAHKLADEPTTSTLSDLSPNDAATGEPVADSGAASGVGNRAPSSKEKKQMSELTQLLQLAEDADAALILAEVKKVKEDAEADRSRADAAEAKLAEGEKAERVRALDESIAGGHVLPAEKDALLALSESSPDAFDATLKAREGVKVIDLSEHGSGEAKPIGKAYQDASVELAEKAKARAKADGIRYSEAESIVLSEDPDLKARYDEFRTPKKEA